MRISRTVYLSLLLTFVLSPAAAADLAKIDRAINKEPAYNGKPKYCILVFGPEAKTRIWLVMDDHSLHVDRNGDLTAAGNWATYNEAYGRWRSGELRGPDGKLRYRVSLRKFRQASAGVQLSVHQNGPRDYIAGDPDAEPLVFGDSPSRAPVIHIGGALATDLGYSVQGETSRSLVLRVRVGTRGLGQGAFAGLVLPHQVFPVAEIEFPPRKAGPPIITKKTLKSR
jgi:hypothetical protein